jgi:hypothetical protein
MERKKKRQEFNRGIEKFTNLGDIYILAISPRGNTKKIERHLFTSTYTGQQKVPETKLPGLFNNLTYPVHRVDCVSRNIFMLSRKNHTEREKKK